MRIGDGGKQFVNGDAERESDSPEHVEPRIRILAGLELDDGVAGDAGALGKFGLGEPLSRPLDDEMRTEILLERRSAPGSSNIG